MRLVKDHCLSSAAIDNAVNSVSGVEKVPDSFSYEVLYADGRSMVRGTDRPAFTFMMRDPDQYGWLKRADLYSAATAFVRGDFDIHGDVISAIRFKKATSRTSWRDVLSAIAALFAPRRLEVRFQSPRRAAQNVRFHYDRSNDFYRAFLDSQMVYSCAYFKDETKSLDEAQNAKLDHICRKLDLRPEESFLDIGCGWGALVIRGAEKYGAVATGCTLSLQQEFFASKTVLEKNLEGRAAVHECDYRKLHGRFNKIASVGMFEHVGRKRLQDYFRKVFDLLNDDGLFLNHGIVRPEGTADGPETLFLKRRVFPGGELATLASVVREAERSGFEVLDVENLRPHYALTCRHWVERLRQNATECLNHVDRETYRTWLLYLAGSALSFETGATDLYQVLMAKRRTAQNRHLTRDYIYA
jgi:cyclopropane-fatty-acyl-phospholipid synthase